MMNHPKVSIITVVYNDVRNIEKTIKSTLSQTYGNKEYIVVDGGSTDGTLDIIKKYDGQIIWKSERDKGIYDAMNKGVDMATGDWIIFRNSGDLFFGEDAIDRVFSNYADNGEAFIAGNIRYSKGDCFKDVRPSILANNYYDAMPFLHPSTFIRSSIQRKYSFDLQYRNSADFDFFVRALKDGANYIYIDSILAVFDASEGASTSNYILSLKENVALLIKSNVPCESIERMKKTLKKEILKKRLSCIPFLSTLIEKYSMMRGNWNK